VDHKILAALNKILAALYNQATVVIKVITDLRWQYLNYTCYQTLK